MKTLCYIVLFIISTQFIVIIETQLISRLLNRLPFVKRNLEEDTYSPHPRRRPPPYRRRRPSDHDPYRYDPDNDDYHRDHTISRPVQRRQPTYRKRKPQEKKQDSEDSAPPMTIYLQAGANGDHSKPRRIRIITVNSHVPFNRELAYGHDNTYHTDLWSRGLLQRDMLFSQNDHQGPTAITSQSTGGYGAYLGADQDHLVTAGPRLNYEYYKKRKRK